MKHVHPVLRLAQHGTRGQAIARRNRVGQLLVPKGGAVRATVSAPMVDILIQFHSSFNLNNSLFFAYPSA
jgi:hypothetical protein